MGSGGETVQAVLGKHCRATPLAPFAKGGSVRDDRVAKCRNGPLTPGPSPAAGRGEKW
jgi:hypothetical protein